MKEFGTAVILAGGKSTRMGFDKQFLQINERRLIDNIKNKLRKEFQEIIIVTNKSEYYLGLDDKITKDKLPSLGPLAGIHAGLLEATSKFVYFIACDMPIVNIEYINYMKESLQDTDYKGCVTEFRDWIEPFNTFYSKEIIWDIENHFESQKRSVFSLLDKLNVLRIKEDRAREFSLNWDMFLNLNTKEDLNNFLKMDAIGD